MLIFFGFREKTCEYRASIKPYADESIITMYANLVTHEKLGFMIKLEEYVHFCNTYIYRNDTKRLVGSTFGTSDVYRLEKRCPNTKMETIEVSLGMLQNKLQHTQACCDNV